MSAGTPKEDGSIESMLPPKALRIGIVFLWTLALGLCLILQREEAVPFVYAGF